MMGEVSRSTLKTYFETRDKPTEAQFEDLIDSLVNKADDKIAQVVDSMEGLLGVDFSALPDGAVVWINNFYDDTEGGGGCVRKVASEDKANHNGGTIINPDHKSIPGSSGWYSSTGEITDDSGSGCWVRPERYIYEIEEFGGRGDGTTDNSSVLTAIKNAGYVAIANNGTYGVSSKITYDVNGTGIVSDNKASLKLLSDTTMIDVGADDVRFENITFDFNLQTTTSQRGVICYDSIKRPVFRDCVFKNMLGGTEGSPTTQDQYALLIDLDNVQQFVVDNCQFKEISNWGDTVVTGPGFAGGVFLMVFSGRAVGSIPNNEQSSGKITNCHFEDIYTRFPSGYTAAQKVPDADAIRTFSGGDLENVDVQISNCSFRRVMKRAVKLSGTGGIQINGLKVDGSEAIDSDVVMSHAVKADNSKTLIDNITCSYGSRRAGHVVQLQDCVGVTINNILVDNCDYIVGDTTDCSDVTINNITAIDHGGLDLGNSTTHNNYSISNAKLIFDRVSDYSGISDHRGCQLFNIDQLDVSNLYIKNGQISTVGSSNITLNDIYIVWDDDTDPSTTSMGTDSIANIHCRSGKNKVNGIHITLPSTQPNYQNSLSEGICRFLVNNANISDIKVESKNNPPILIYIAEDSVFNNLQVDSDYRLNVGNQSGIVSNLKINNIDILNANCELQLIRTLTNVFIRDVVKTPSSSTSLLVFNNDSFTDVHIDTIYWDDDTGGGGLNSTTGLTVYNERTLT